MTSLWTEGIATRRLSFPLRASWSVKSSQKVGRIQNRWKDVGRNFGKLQHSLNPQNFCPAQFWIYLVFQGVDLCDIHGNLARWYYAKIWIFVVVFPLLLMVPIQGSRTVAIMRKLWEAAITIMRSRTTKKAAIIKNILTIMECNYMCTLTIKRSQRTITVAIIKSVLAIIV